VYVSRLLSGALDVSADFIDDDVLGDAAESGIQACEQLEGRPGI